MSAWRQAKPSYLRVFVSLRLCVFVFRLRWYATELDIDMVTWSSRNGKDMSIFATTLGARPVAAQQAHQTVQECNHNAIAQPLIASELGSRPQGECPHLIDWGGIVLHEASEPAIQVPPASTAPLLGSDEMLAAIDAALRQNTAQVAVNGLIVTE
jgi:hypothetical protein